MSCRRKIIAASSMTGDDGKGIIGSAADKVIKRAINSASDFLDFRTAPIDQMLSCPHGTEASIFC